MATPFSLSGQGVGGVNFGTSAQHGSTEQVRGQFFSPAILVVDSE